MINTWVSNTESISSPRNRMQSPPKGSVNYQQMIANEEKEEREIQRVKNTNKNTSNNHRNKVFTGDIQADKEIAEFYKMRDELMNRKFS